MLHCFFLTAPHFICAREEQELSELELPSATEVERCLTLCAAQVDTPTRCHHPQPQEAQVHPSWQGQFSQCVSEDANLLHVPLAIPSSEHGKLLYWPGGTL